MSISENPMTGEMRQSMANFVTTTCHGQNVIRKKVFKPRNVNSLAQQRQRESFKLIVDLYESFGGITDEGFPGRPRTYSPYNAFMKANLDTAINNTGAVPVVDYTKLRVAEGSLPRVVVNSGTVGATGITLSYETDTEVARVSATDQVVAFALLAKGSLLMARQVRGNMATNTILLPYTGVLAADVVCCYLFILNKDGSKVSDSVYVLVG